MSKEITHTSCRVTWLTMEQWTLQYVPLAGVDMSIIPLHGCQYMAERSWTHTLCHRETISWLQVVHCFALHYLLSTLSKLFLSTRKIILQHRSRCLHQVSLEVKHQVSTDDREEHSEDSMIGPSDAAGWRRAPILKGATKFETLPDVKNILITGGAGFMWVLQAMLT